MARIRTIKPTFFRSQDMADLPLTARLTFVGLWTYVDDAGRGIDDARLVKGDLWQLDERHSIRKVEADLALLAENGHIERYETNGRRYLRIVEWKHQRINRPTPSTIPASINESAVRGNAPRTEPSPPEGKGMEGNKERKGSDSAPSERGVAGLSAEPVAREVSPPPAADGGGGSLAPNTSLDKAQVDLNVSSARAARSSLRAS